MPRVVDAHDHSYTRRRRAYWTNFALPDDYTADFPRKSEPNECMDAGRTVHRVMNGGQLVVRTIGKSWRGDPSRPGADTLLPVLVDDRDFEKVQHLRPAEAERLMGMPTGCSAAPGITAKQRLKGIGNGWDINVVTMFLKHIKPKAANGSLYDECSVFTVADQDQLLLQALLKCRDRMSIDEFAGIVALHGAAEQLKILQLLAVYYSKTGPVLHVRGQCSVLDSGSSRHLNPDVHVTDPEETVMLTGFDNSQSLTTGNGFLPVLFYDQNTGTAVKADIEDVDRMPGLNSSLLSLGKLLRAGYEFHFGEQGRDCYMLTPSGV